VSLINLIIIAYLAGYRITGLLNAQDQEDGPVQLLKKFRARIGITYDDRDDPSAANGVAEAFVCPMCLSVWVGIGLTLVVAAAYYLHFIEVAAFILLPFAISAVTVALRRFLGA